jgi:recombination protein RecR
MAAYTQSIEKLIEKLSRFPGVGRRSAERIIGYVLNAPKDEIKTLADTLMEVKNNVRACRICHNFSEEDVCKICQDSRRKKDIVCVVERPADVTALEKAGSYTGVYHVLLGSISPLEGKGPQDLKIDELMNRIRANGIHEIIIATDADNEGETTALYLTKLIKPLAVKLTRIGVGIPMGANLEYSDSPTLSKAMEARREI